MSSDSNVRLGFDYEKSLVNDGTNVKAKGETYTREMSA